MKIIKPTSAKKFLVNKFGRYEFPFKVLDDTPGGSNLGRIELCVELFRSSRKREGRYYIEKIWVWFKQTRDKRYDGKIFEIPCFVEAIGGDRHDGNSFTTGVWHTSYCDLHKQIIMMAYPKNHHTKLIINAFSSVMADIEFG